MALVRFQDMWAVIRNGTRRTRPIFFTDDMLGVENDDKSQIFF